MNAKSKIPDDNGPIHPNAVPSDCAQSVSISVKKEIKIIVQQTQQSNVLISESDLVILKMPRQPISVIEPIIRNYLVRLYEHEYKQTQVGLKYPKEQWDLITQESLDEFFHQKRKDAKAQFIKRDRLRFFAKAIISGRISNINDCFLVSKNCTRVSLLNNTRGMVGFILADLALFHMMLSFSNDMLEAYSSLFIAQLINMIAHSLVVLVGVIQIISIMTENQPLKMQHYVQICFVLLMTTLGLIGYCTGLPYFSLVSSSLSIFRNITIFLNEYTEYQKAEPESDKQMAHKQACISILNDILLTSLSVAVMLIVLLTPLPGTSLTALILVLTLAKLTWQLMSSKNKMHLKSALGFGKVEYNQILEPDALESPVTDFTPSSEVGLEPFKENDGPYSGRLNSLMVTDTSQLTSPQEQALLQSDKNMTKRIETPLEVGVSANAQKKRSNSAKRRDRRKKLALFSHSVAAEPTEKVSSNPSASEKNDGSMDEVSKKTSDPSVS